ncbi:protein-tyrosine-phosphatase [Caulobacter sp. AP07]|uniref:arsenate-mycothiol transferase ArsC n=1 Tax=Caulobacter sp. AP07 TaxID=1144304 RepID=UPI0002720C1F|nr:low molecular weight phosphatase family protein [Caulobacter sp. AP07]EJL31901.1 protein-tyrosine-phosphatase [Caulobacter sp. AP07]
MSGLPDAVLFACNYNRVRSPMAEALFRHFYGARAFVDSCGLKGDPAGEVDPFVAVVMDEMGLDVGDHRPKSFGHLEDDSFDVVISLTPEAQHRAVELARHRATDIEYWPTHDPSLAIGSRDAMLAAYREVRDALANAIRQRFGAPSTFGG